MCMLMGYPDMHLYLYSHIYNARNVLLNYSMGCNYNFTMVTTSVVIMWGEICGGLS